MKKNNTVEKLGKKLIDGYISSLLTKNDLNLLNLIFSKNPSQAELNKFLSVYDIEVSGGYKSLLLSYFMKLHPELIFTNYETPRLKGLLNFYKFQNLKLASYFIKIGRVFKENNIEMLILKGFAMKCIRPDLSRAMGDIDILVQNKDFIKAIDLCKELGFRMDVYPHSIDLHEPTSEAGVMDIHRWIEMDNRKGHLLNKYLFKRAKTIKVNNLETLIPSNEDMFFLSLVNLAKNLSQKTSKPSTLYVLFDCKYLLEQPNFDYDIVIKNVKLTNTTEKVAFAIKFINSIVPDLIPSEIANHPVLKNCVDKSCVKLLFNRYYEALRIIAHRMKIRDVFTGKTTIFAYLRLKIYHKFCKQINGKNYIKIKSWLLKKRY